MGVYMASTNDLDIGLLLREVRRSVGLSLDAMSRETHYSKSTLGHVETGRRRATPEIIEAYERVIGSVEIEVGDTVFWRRDITHPALAKVRGAAKLAQLTKGIAEGNPGVLAEAPTAHATDLAIIHRVTPDGIGEIRRWMVEGKTSTLRTNALAVIAKTPGVENAQLVADVLENDPAVRRLCITSEISRILQLDWETCKVIARDIPSCPNPKRFARKLVKEVTDPNDTESRWCGAYMLKKLAPVLGR
ncbi:helix-turn-helix domain-containing protein [Saccharopolyspora phatthalungensis]|uniref:Transcriptional regulator with XRE-family HTH domain n=1 Tax=Saccharopolyspora phatthalungensis TaxID=664693 RepID=A0A840QI88_9PSEU|nr:helix-turn-helix transcriptional regulator [Saccharopolyspora phatthalungensis]MBB5159991.1 transcriptional regulator with XRE-family HTH domain [Saccharopolyspora phatthalungensis]